MKKINTLQHALLVLFTSQFLFTSCANYYKAVNAPVTNNTDKTAKLESLKSGNRTFILRSGNQAFEIKEIVTNAAENKIECMLDTLSDLHKLHLTKGTNGKMRYKKYQPDQNSVLNEVHVYVTPAGKTALGKTSIALNDIQKIEVIEKDKGRTRESYILGGVGITAGVAAIATAIFLATFDLTLLGGN